MISEIRAEFGLYLGIATYEVIMGICYNRLTAWMERKGYMEGFVSLVVAGGVFLTLIPFLLFSLPSFTVVGGFVLSGLPMVIGSISRYLSARDQARREIARIDTDGNEPKGMAE